jgi:hypothetical protein
MTKKDLRDLITFVVLSPTLVVIIVLILANTAWVS